MRKESYYKTIIKMTLPIAVQNLLSAMISSMDVLMLNYVGQDAISAAALASNYANILFMVLFGIGTGATILCAQYYGKGDLESVRKVEGISFRFSIPWSVILGVLALLIPRQLMMIFTPDPVLIELGATYLRIVSLAYVCWGITEVYLSILRSIGRVRISMILNIAAFVINIILNAIFIFGLFGLPKMGIAGVALATSMSRLCELVLAAIVSAFSKDIKLSFRYMFGGTGILTKDFFSLALPALINDISWGTAFSMYSVILGHMNSDIVAANSIVSVVRNFATVLCYGVGSAGAIIVGNLIGDNQMDKARTYGSKIMRATVATGILGGVAIFALSPFILDFADLNDIAKDYLHFMLLIHTYYILGMAVNTALIAGLFRAGGDSRFGMICDTIDMWCYSVPLALLAAFVFKFPAKVVYFLMCTDEFVKWPIVIKHYLSGKWLRNITRDNTTSDT